MVFVADNKHRITSFSQSLDVVILFKVWLSHCLGSWVFLTKLFSVCHKSACLERHMDTAIFCHHDIKGKTLFLIGWILVSRNKGQAMEWTFEWQLMLAWLKGEMPGQLWAFISFMDMKWQSLSPLMPGMLNFLKAKGRSVCGSQNEMIRN